MFGVVIISDFTTSTLLHVQIISESMELFELYIWPGDRSRQRKRLWMSMWPTVKLNWNGEVKDVNEVRGWRVGGVIWGGLGLREQEWEKERERETIYRAKRRSMYSQWSQQPQDVAPVHLHLFQHDSLKTYWPFSKKQLVENSLWLISLHKGWK